MLCTQPARRAKLARTAFFDGHGRLINWKNAFPNDVFGFNCDVLFGSPSWKMHSVDFFVCIDKEKS
jgi:hypothetical protein